MNTVFYQYLLDNGYSGQFNDMAMEFLGDQGFSGALNERLYKYFGSLGYTGVLSERLYQWSKSWWVVYSIDGNTPALVLDYEFNRYMADSVTEGFDDLHTVSRSTTGTYFDADGNLQTAAINEARLDHDLVTGADLGLLVEPQRTNLVAYYECKDGTGWSDTGAVSTNLSLNALGAFDGVSVASQGAVWNRLLSNNMTLTNATTYAATFLYREGTSGQVMLNFRNTTTSTESDIRGAPGSLSAVQSAAGSITDISETLLADGATWMVTCLFTPNANGAVFQSIGPLSTSTGETIIAIGAQLEEGDYPTSLIPTSGASATRAADDVSVALSEFGFDTSEGTVLVEAVTPPGLGSGVLNHVAYRIRDEAASSYIQVRRFDDGANEVVDATIVDGGVAQFDPVGDLNGIGHEETFKVALAWKANDFGFSVNGGTTETDNSGTVPTSLDTLEVGSGTGGNVFWGGHIKRLIYYPSRLSDATLQELSA